MSLTVQQMSRAASLFVNQPFQNRIHRPDRRRCNSGTRWWPGRSSRSIEHLGSAHDEVELEALKVAAASQLTAGQTELDLGLTAGVEPDTLAMRGHRVLCRLAAVSRGELAGALAPAGWDSLFRCLKKHPDHRGAGPLINHRHDVRQLHAPTECEETVKRSAAPGFASCSVGELWLARDLLRASRPRYRRDSAHPSCCSSNHCPDEAN